ncbi:MAG: hypothetical protein AB1489_40660 [Acidobacteriota bacterium]
MVSVKRGEEGKFTVKIDRNSSFTGNVVVSTPDTKADKIKLSPAKQSTTDNSVSFDFAIKKSAAIGTQQLIFSGRDDVGRLTTITFTLTIQ